MCTYGGWQHKSMPAACVTRTVTYRTTLRCVQSSTKLFFYLNFQRNDFYISLNLLLNGFFYGKYGKLWRCFFQTDSFRSIVSMFNWNVNNLLENWKYESFCSKWVTWSTEIAAKFSTQEAHHLDRVAMMQREQNLRRYSDELSSIFRLNWGLISPISFCVSYEKYWNPSL